jgi:hypothetical protein
MLWLQIAGRTKLIAFDASVLVEYDPDGIAGADAWLRPVIRSRTPERGT